jgi:hypothetical protein
MSENTWPVTQRHIQEDLLMHCLFAQSNQYDDFMSAKHSYLSYYTMNLGYKTVLFTLENNE